VNITQDLSDYTEQKCVEEKQALEEGMKEMSEIFVEKGSEIYTKTS